MTMNERDTFWPNQHCLILNRTESTDASWSPDQERGHFDACYARRRHSVIAGTKKGWPCKFPTSFPVLLFMFVWQSEETLSMSEGLCMENWSSLSRYKDYSRLSACPFVKRDARRERRRDRCAMVLRNHSAWNITTNLEPHGKSVRLVPALQERSNVDPSEMRGSEIWAWHFLRRVAHGVCQTRFASGLVVQKSVSTGSLDTCRKSGDWLVPK